MGDLKSGSPPKSLECLKDSYPTRFVDCGPANDRDRVDAVSSFWKGLASHNAGRR